MPVGELLSSFLVQFYEGERMVPPEVVLPVAIEDAIVLRAAIPADGGDA